MQSFGVYHMNRMFVTSSDSFNPSFQIAVEEELLSYLTKNTIQDKVFLVQMSVTRQAPPGKSGPRTTWFFKSVLCFQDKATASFASALGCAKASNNNDTGFVGSPF